MQSIKLKNYAKINLAIDVLSRRIDGYHEVDMIMSTVDLCDEVTLSTKSDIDKGWFLLDENIDIIVNDPTVPTDSRNLVCKAVKNFKDYVKEKNIKKNNFLDDVDFYDVKEKRAFEIQINLNKNIPSSAGLAGGSGNAAAVLHALNIVTNSGLSVDELIVIAKKIGADVPFLVLTVANLNDEIKEYQAGLDKKSMLQATLAVRARGVGEKLEPVNSFDAFVLLVNPGFDVFTGEVYSRLNLWDEQGNKVIKKEGNCIEKFQCMLNSEYSDEVDYDKLKTFMKNDLESYTLKAYPEVKGIKEALAELAPESIVMMSGSGPTVYAIADSPITLEKAYNEFRGKYRVVHIVRMLK